MNTWRERSTVAGIGAIAVLSVGMIAFGNASLAADAERDHRSPAGEQVSVVTRADRR